MLALYDFFICFLYSIEEVFLYLAYMQQQSLQEYRCMCGKLLFKGSIVHEIVEIKCKHCRKISAFGGAGASDAPLEALHDLVPELSR